MRKLFLFVLAILLSLSAFAQQSRHFTFQYAFSVKNVQPGQKIEIWFPQAHSDQFQDVKIVSVTGDLPLKTSRDTKYGNTIYHAVAPKAAKDEYTFDVRYDVVRHERIGLPRTGSAAAARQSVGQGGERIPRARQTRPDHRQAGRHRRPAGAGTHRHHGQSPRPVRLRFRHHEI